MTPKSKLPKSSRAFRPVTARCNFYISDDVRIEQGGKPSLLGFYPDNVIVVLMPEGAKEPTKEQPIGLVGLAILANFIGARGLYDIETELFGPDGLSLTKASGGKTPSEAENFNFVSRFQPMPIVGFGQYKVVINLNDKPFTLTFEVRRGKLPHPAQEQIVYRRASVAKTKAIAKKKM